MESLVADRRKLVLYADDDADDRSWVQDACAALDNGLDVRFVGNGREVLRYLDQCVDGSCPNLVVLDLNMPEMDGRQTLQAIKSHPRFGFLPVVIVTTSNNRIDREVCQRLGASLFLTKPDTHAAWQGIVQQWTALLQ